MLQDVFSILRPFRHPRHLNAGHATTVKQTFDGMLVCMLANT